MVASSGNVQGGAAANLDSGVKPHPERIARK